MTCIVYSERNLKKNKPKYRKHVFPINASKRLPTASASVRLTQENPSMYETKLVYNNGSFKVSNID